MATVRREKPMLFFNTGAEDREAYFLIKSSGMPCEFHAPSMDESTPLLLVGYQRFIGIDQIQAFLAGCKKDKVRKE